MVWSYKVKLPSSEYYTVKELLGKGDSNAKLNKSDNAGRGYATVGLSLAPAKESGYEMCKGRSKGCTAACIFTSGKGAMKMVQQARIAKTILLMEHRQTFIDRLICELIRAEKAANKENKQLACRLNVFSDFPWEAEIPSLFTLFPNVQFYDYTKIYGRAVNFSIHSPSFPKNYHLTFSRSENNDNKVGQLLAYRVNIAVVFD